MEMETYVDLGVWLQREGRQQGCVLVWRIERHGRLRADPQSELLTGGRDTGDRLETGLQVANGP